MAQVADTATLTRDEMVQKSRSRDNRREFPRYRAEDPFVLTFKSEGRMYRGQLVDISLSGALMLCPSISAPLNELLFENPETGELFYGRVRWQSGVRMGIEFDFSGEALHFISQCLNASEELFEQQLSAEA